MSTLDHAHIEEAGLDDWRHLLHTLHARFATGDFATGLRFVDAVGAAAEEVDHHPDVDLRYPHVDVRLRSHDAGGVTDRDLRLAATISRIARDLDVSAEPARLHALEIALDTPDAAAVRPFWAAVLGGSLDPDRLDEVRDGSGLLPPLWFQESGADEPRQRFHLDVVVPPEVARERIAAALAAGGTLADEESAPAYTVLADADGNRVCICTPLGREG